MAKRPPSLAGDARVHWTFLANTYATGWFWHPRGAGLLHCTDGLLQFEPSGSIPLRTPRPFQHTHPRVLLLTPWAIPRHFTVVVFQHGAVSISIARNHDQIRTVIRECGFEIVDAPPKGGYPFNQRRAWDAHMRERVLAEQFPRGAVIGGAAGSDTMRVRCQACRGVVVLEYHDVHGRWASAAAAGSSANARWSQFDADRPLAAGESPVDMRCPHCDAPMRVIVSAQEWRMSLWSFRVVEVLVLVPDSGRNEISP